MAKDMAILGTGAIGSSIGADLTKAGHNALFIDQWPAHIEAMKAHGLRVIIIGDVGSNATLSLSICQPLLSKTPLTPGPSASTSTPCYGISPSIIMS